MPMKHTLLLLLCFLSIGFSKTFTLGVSLPLSGDFEAEGRKMANAIQMAVDDQNRQGGLPGKIRLVLKDDRNEAASAKTVAEELTREPNLIGVIGSYYASTLAGGAAEAYAKAKVPVLSPFESSTGEKSPWIFDLNYTDEAQAEMMALHLKHVLKVDNLLLIHNTDAFGLGSKDAFLAKAEKMGLRVKRVLFYDHQKKFGDDFIAAGMNPGELADIGGVVVFSHASSGMKLVKQLHEAGYAGPIFGPHTFADRRFLDPKQIDASATKSVYVTAPFTFELANDRAYDFRVRYVRRHREDPGAASPLAYDAALLFAEALRAVGPGHEAIRVFLGSLTWKTALPGLTGQLFFNARQAIDRDVSVSRMEHGRLKTMFRQYTRPHEDYIFAEVAERTKKGTLIVEDGTPFQVLDVVYVGVDFLRIHDIDTRNMSYEAEIFVWYKWQSEKIDVGQIDIQNLLNRKETVLVKEDLTKPVKYRCYRIKATFQAPFDLARFPFDSQKLPVSIAPRTLNSTHLMLCLDTRHMDDQPVNEINPQEWDYAGKHSYSGLYQFHSSFGAPEYRMTAGYQARITFSQVKVNLEVRRILFPYLFNLYLPLMIIILVALFILHVAVDQHTVRINGTFTALLAILVYYMAQKAALPRVGYLMKADHYFILSFLFIITLMIGNLRVMHLAVKKLSEEANRFNRLFFWIFLPSTILCFVFVTLFL